MDNNIISQLLKDLLGSGKKPTGDATTADVRAGKGFSNSDGIGKIGTLPVRSTEQISITPGTTNQVLQPGIYDDTITITGDADLAEANIKSGVNLFGKLGTFSNTANAPSAGQILTGKSAFANGIQIDGTMPNRGGVTITPGSSDKPIAEGYHNGTGIVEGDPDLAAGNIKTGVTIFGVGGSFTADATATAGQILSGKTAYVNGVKITGTIPSKTAQTYTPGTSNQTIASGQYLSGTQTIAGDADLVAGNIKTGVNIFGVAGSFTADASAAAGEILSGKTAYVNGAKVTGTMANNGSQTATLSITGSGKPTKTVPAGYTPGGTITAEVTGQEANIKQGVTIGGCEGTYVGGVIAGTDIHIFSVASNITQAGPMAKKVELVMNTPGTYWFNIRYTASGVGTDYGYCQIKKNGVSVLNGAYSRSSAYIQDSATFNVGDTCEIWFGVTGAAAGSCTLQASDSYISIGTPYTRTL